MGHKTALTPSTHGVVKFNIAIKLDELGLGTDKRFQLLDGQLFLD